MWLRGYRSELEVFSKPIYRKTVSQLENNVIRSAKTSTNCLKLFCYLKYFQLTSEPVTKAENSKFRKKFSAFIIHAKKNEIV